MRPSRARKGKRMNINQKINSMADAVVEQELKNLPQTVQSVIRSSILSILGLDHNGREIDHCNGRWNLFSEVLKAEAKLEVEKLVKDIKARFDTTLFTEAFQKEYMNHFRYHLKYEAERLAKEKVQSFVKTKLDKFVENINRREVE